MISRYVQAILVEVRWGYVIIHLFRKWLCFEPQKRIIAKTIPKAPTNQDQIVNQELSTEQATKDEQLIQEWLDCNKASDSSKSNWIAIDLTKEQLTKHKNKYKYCQRSEV